jgi:xanthine phosphoribosyltransferase
MEELEERILKDGLVLDNGAILRVDSFINQQIDTALLNDICAYLAKPFKNIDKVLTVETSGIAFALGVAQHLGNIPVVFAKKSKSKIVDENNLYTAEVKSFTRGSVSTISVDRRFLLKGEKILLVDDFLAEGNACLGLYSMCSEAQCSVRGVAVVIEKRFQGGRTRLEKLGLSVRSAAAIVGFEEGKAIFAPEGENK